MSPTPSHAISRIEPVPFRPARWLPGGHMQTLGARWIRRRLPVEYARERVETDDGDFFDVDIGPGPPDAPVLILLHGLEGSSRSGYVVEAGRHAASSGLRPVALNARSRSGELNRKAGSYHAGHTADIGRAVDWLRDRFSGRPIGAIGFSLGGNALAKYLGERGREAGIATAALISVPFDLSASADRMERGLSSLYVQHFLKSLNATIRAKARQHPDSFDLDALKGIRTIRQFDEVITAPVHGFAGAEDYYAQSSSAAYIPAIEVPTLIIQARDDPLVPEDTIPQGIISACRSLDSRITEGGGHVGFVEGAGPWAARVWAEAEAVRFLSAHLLDPTHVGGASE